MNRVLFVDDDSDVIERLKAAFEHHEWDMHFVASGQAALASMDEEPADVVVSELLMPGMGGVELLAEVRRRHPDTVRLLLLDEDDERGLVEGAAVAHQFLPKPGPLDKLAGAVDRALRLHRDLGGERVRAEMSGIDVLLTPQGVLGELMDVLQSPSADAASIARILERDVALSAKVLQLANASFFAPRTRATSVRGAVVRLGTQTIRSLALMDGMIRSCDVRDKTLRRWLVRFNTHAMETARLAGQLAGNAGNDAFCAGLLHDCGQLVFATCRPEVFSAHLGLQDTEARLLVEIEEETFGVTHAQAGAYLLSLWGLPLEVITAASIHSAPIHLGRSGRLSASLAAQLAHHLVEAEVLTLCSTPGSPAPDDAMLDRAGVLGDVWAWRAERAADDNDQDHR